MFKIEAIIFYSVAEYCDNAGKLTIKIQGNQIRIEIWSSGEEEIRVSTKDYKSYKDAYKNYKMQIGDAILGGWKVLNRFPQRETWETKRCK